jgi:hypothetical protein
MLNKALLDQLQAVLTAHETMYQDDNVTFTDVLAQYQTAVKAVFEALKENWQYDALVKLLETPRKEVETGKRFYFSSATYGSGLYHLLDKKYDGVQIEQVDIDEKWNKRVNLYTDEIPGVLAALLTWHLEQVKEELAQEAKYKDGAFLKDDGLGNLDDHPF